MQEADIEITQADGGPLEIKGMTRLPVRIGKLKSTQNFYVTPNLCTEAILGEDWLQSQRTRIEFNPTVLVVNGERTPVGGPPEGSYNNSGEGRYKATPQNGGVGKR